MQDGTGRINQGLFETRKVFTQSHDIQQNAYYQNYKMQSIKTRGLLNDGIRTNTETLNRNLHIFPSHAQRSMALTRMCQIMGKLL